MTPELLELNQNIINAIGDEIDSPLERRTQHAELARLSAIVRECIRTRERVQEFWETLIDLLASGEAVDYEAVGPGLRGLLATAVGMMSKAVGLCREFHQRHGSNVPKETELLQALESTEKLSRHIEAEWPTFGPPSAVSEEGIPLDEAFAKIAGCSQTEWNETVSRHERNQGQTPR